jgi:hypothetical protein
VRLRARGCAGLQKQLQSSSGRGAPMAWDRSSTWVSCAIGCGIRGIAALAAVSIYSPEGLTGSRRPPAAGCPRRPARAKQVLLGTAHGAVMLCWRAYFGQRIMGALFGAATMVSSIGMARGPWAGYSTRSTAKPGSTSDPSASGGNGARLPVVRGSGSSGHECTTPAKSRAASGLAAPELRLSALRARAGITSRGS